MLGIILKPNYNQFKIHFASSKLFVVLKKDITINLKEKRNINGQYKFR